MVVSFIMFVFVFMFLFMWASCSSFSSSLCVCFRLCAVAESNGFGVVLLGDGAGCLEGGASRGWRCLREVLLCGGAARGWRCLFTWIDDPRNICDHC